MAKVTSSLSGTTYTYTITDQAGNTTTVVAQANPSTAITISGTLLADAQWALANLLNSLAPNGPNPRPQVFANAASSFYS